MSIRLSGLQNISSAREDLKVDSAVKEKSVIELFNKNVFNYAAYKKYLMRDAYDNLMQAISNNEGVDERTADFVAVGMKNWAMDNGATHYSHWFQPLTGKSAGKHDAFFKLDKKGRPIESFNGKILVQQEPDGSSFPNGGLRETHTARGYSVWDPTSFAFLTENDYGKVLCIPAIFISYTGESLDLKTPLLKSAYALDKAATDVCRYFYDDVKNVKANLGWEQEYFLVDDNLYNARPDLVLCGRTLFGNASARGQQLDDHYFADIPERVQNFMIDMEKDCYVLGIPLTTRHNEVAPNQYEAAPYFESVNISADHNQLLMELMSKVGKRHGLRVLFHEKPYAGINGSGKHNNWSLATNTGLNLFDPGDEPNKNIVFITFIITFIKAINDHAELLRASIATHGNEHRLGAQEAPPAIISVFTGDDVSNLFDKFMNDDLDKPIDMNEEININLQRIAKIQKDATDRNRTSPLPFTGNRFEFRAVGSSVNVSNPMTVLNTMVADQLINFKNDVDSLISDGLDKDLAINKILKSYLNESQKVIFNGDGYSQEWIDEAKRRGLANIRSTPVALKAYISDRSKGLFTRNKIFNERELIARFNVSIQEYTSRLEIESLLVEEIANTQIMPSVVTYQNKLIKNVNGLQNIGLNNEAESNKLKLTEISGHLQGMIDNLTKMTVAKNDANKLNSEYETACAYCDNVKPYFDLIRIHADKLEMLVDDKVWPLPKYRELLFLH